MFLEIRDTPVHTRQLSGSVLAVSALSVSFLYYVVAKSCYPSVRQMAFIAKRDIKKGEELLFTYKEVDIPAQQESNSRIRESSTPRSQSRPRPRGETDRWQLVNQIVCCCGDEHCRKAVF